MKKILFSALLALCVVGATAQKASDAYKAEKSISENFVTSSSPSLSAACRYTELTINNWAKDAIEVKAEIKITCSNTKKVQAILEYVNVTATKRGDMVSVITDIDSKSIEAIKGRNENMSYTIKININAPLGTTMNVDNKYGNTYVQGTASSLTANIKYGNLAVGTIGKPSSVTIKYGNLKIDRATDLDLGIKYGNATVEQIENLKIVESGYGKHKYGSVNNVTGSVKYDGYSFGTITGALNFSSARYTNISIETLEGSVNIGELAYGALKVNRTMHSFGGINVSASYSNIVVSVDKGIASNMALFTSYGKLYPDIFGNTKYEHDKTNQSFTMTLLGATSDKWIKITNRYGNIRVTDK